MKISTFTCHFLCASLLTFPAVLSPGMAQTQVPQMDMSLDGELNQSDDTAPLPSSPEDDSATPTAPQPDTPPAGMNHFSVTGSPKAAPEKQEAAQPAPQTAPTAPVPAAKTYTPLAPKDALIKPDKLRPWANLSATAMGHNKEDAINVVNAIEADRGAVPPQGLFLAAKLLADQGYMQPAAVYYFVGQLRLSFDVMRWPPYVSDSDKAQREQDKNKSPDQRAPTLGDSTQMINPHAGVSALAEGMGQPIIKWALRNPANMEDALQQAAAWDISAPYAYDPGYSVGTPIPYEDWEQTLTSARQAYFDSMTRLTKTMKRTDRP